MGPTFDHPRHQKGHHLEEEQEILVQAEEIETEDKDITQDLVVAVTTEIHPTEIIRVGAQEVGKGKLSVIGVHMVP